MLGYAWLPRSDPWRAVSHRPPALRTATPFGRTYGKLPMSGKQFLSDASTAPAAARPPRSRESVQDTRRQEVLSEAQREQLNALVPVGKHLALELLIRSL